MVSALLWSGPSNQSLRLAETEQVTLCYTQPMLDELNEVLQRRKFHRQLQLRGLGVADIMENFLPLVEVYPPMPITGIVIADADDDIFIACALSANADYLISGDDHLLRLKQYGAIKIVKPAEFLRVFRNSR
jgi:putative PIN family toxin of toxin-antitoxin system